LPGIRRRRRPAGRALSAALEALDTARRAEANEGALLAERTARDADAAAVPDQQVREATPVLTRDELHQVALDLHRVLVLGQSKPLGEPAYVRVDDDALGVSELRRDDVRRFPGHAG